MFTTLKTLAILGTLTGSAILGTQAVSAHEVDVRYATPDCPPARVIYHNDNDHRFDRDDRRFDRDDRRFDRDEHRQMDRRFEQHLEQHNDHQFRYDARR